MIEGVRKIDSGEWSVYFIDQLSDALKIEIRHHLSTSQQYVLAPLMRIVGELLIHIRPQQGNLLKDI